MTWYHQDTCSYMLIGPAFLSEACKKEIGKYYQQSVETNPKMGQMLKLAEKDFKSSSITTNGNKGKHTFNK